MDASVTLSVLVNLLIEYDTWTVVVDILLLICWNSSQHEAVLHQVCFLCNANVCCASFAKDTTDTCAFIKKVLYSWQVREGAPVCLCMIFIKAKKIYVYTN